MSSANPLSKVWRHLSWRVRALADDLRHARVYHPRPILQLKGTRFRQLHPASTPRWPPVETLGKVPVDFGHKLTEAFRAMGVAEMEGGLINLQRGHIFDAEGNFAIDAAFADWKLAQYRQLHWRRKPERTLKGRTLSILSEFADFNFGHFLMDAIGRVALLRKAGIAMDGFDHYLVPNMPGQEAQRVLAACGIPDDSRRIRSVDSVRYAAVEHLTFATFPGCTWNYPHWLAPFLQTLVPPVDTPASKRIYLIRRSEGGNAVNESELQTLVRRFGFETLDPMDFVPDSHRLFQEASHVIGIHGAPLAGVAFAQTGARFLEILPAHHVEPYYFTLSQSAGMRYFCFIGETVVPEGRRARDAAAGGSARFDIRVDLESFEQALERFTTAD